MLMGVGGQRGRIVHGVSHASPASRKAPRVVGWNMEPRNWSAVWDCRCAFMGVGRQRIGSYHMFLELAWPPGDLGSNAEPRRWGWGVFRAIVCI